MEPLNIDFNRQLARALMASGRSAEAKRYFQRILSLVPDDIEASQSLASQFPAISDTNSVLVVQGKSEGRLVEKQMVDALEPSVSGKILFEVQPGSNGISQSAPEEIPAAEIVKADKEPAIPEKTDLAITPDKKVVTAAVNGQNSLPEPIQVVPAVVDAKSEPQQPEPSNVVADKSEPAIAPGLKEEPKAEQPGLELSAAADAQVSRQARADTQRLVKAVERAGIAAVDAGVGGEKDGFRDAVALEPEKQSQARKIEEFRRKGSYEFTRGNWEAALPNYLEVLKYKKDAQTYDMIGVIFEKLSMHKDAFDAIERSYKLGRKDSVTLTRLGRLAEVTGNYTKGEEYLRKALEVSPHRV
ncbi:MAG: tetratricopeptide repeat protein, partial [Candidatus Riflebacteria bacterium]|nr:tetratricopeptide repeat protein [Candidatus Riflebacteria bacterium]